MNKLLVFVLLFLSLAISVSASNCDGVSIDGKSIVNLVNNPDVCTAYVWSLGSQSYCCDAPYVVGSLCHQVSLVPNGTHVEVSSNGGSSWSSYKVSVGDDLRYNTFVACDGINKNCFVTGSNGVWSSNDFGRTWGKILGNAYSRICVSSDGRYVFISGSDFRRSDNFGSSFVKVDSPMYGESIVSPNFVRSLGITGGGSSFNVLRSPIHTGGHLLDISSDGRYVVVASSSSGTFGGGAWSSSNFGVTMIPFGIENKYSGLFSSDDFKTVVLTNVGSYGYGSCVEQIGGMSISSDSGVSFRFSGLGVRNWVNVSVSNSVISVLSNPTLGNKVGYGSECLTLDSYSLRPSGVDTSTDGGLTWSTRTSLSSSEQSQLTGRLIDIPNDGNVSNTKTIILVGIAIVLVVLLLYIVFRPKKSRRR